MAAAPLTYARFHAPEAANGTLDVYEAGSLQNRKTTYALSSLTSANANPVVLNALGQADVFYSGLARLVLKDSTGAQIWDKDNIGLSGDTSTQYVNSLSATYSSSTQFTISGDQTTEYHVNRIVRLTGSSTAYGRITASSYSNPNTTVTVVLTSGALDATLATAATSLLAANSTSGVPFSHVQGSDVASVAGTTVLNTVIGDYCFITGTNAITAFTLTKGRHMFVKASGAFSMTHSANLILPGAANITAVAGDTFILIGEASGVVRCIHYSRASAPPVIFGSFTGTTTGLSAEDTGTINYVRMGPLVLLDCFEVISGTSDEATFTITGMPAEITPSNSTTGKGIVQIINNGTAEAGHISTGNSGVLTFGRISSTAANTFTTSGTKGVAAFSYMYYID